MEATNPVYIVLGKVRRTAGFLMRRIIVANFRAYIEAWNYRCPDVNTTNIFESSK